MGATMEILRTASLPLSILRQIRVRQWTKNLLVFVPLLLIHRLDDFDLFLRCVLTFFAFSAMASASYIINDFKDLSSDRDHPIKRGRPLASGALPQGIAIALIPSLMAVSLVFSTMVSPLVTAAIALYFIASLSYSLYAKQFAALDVVILGLLYPMRLVAGGYAVEVPVSFWLVAFSMFLFLSLALVKRYSEILAYSGDDDAMIAGRDYMKSDLPLLSQIGISSGLISVLVLALYVNSDTVTIRYTSPEFIWGLCPIAAYWICRIWILATRGKLHDDPVLFATYDPPTYVMAAISLAIIWLAV